MPLLYPITKFYGFFDLSEEFTSSNMMHAKLLMY